MASVSSLVLPILAVCGQGLGFCMSGVLGVAGGKLHEVALKGAVAL